MKHDLHTKTAAEVFGVKPEDVTPEQRARGKAINFARMYKASPQKIARTFGLTDPEAQRLAADYSALELEVFKRIRWEN